MALTITSNLTTVTTVTSTTNWETSNLAAGHGLDSDQNIQGSNCYAGQTKNTATDTWIVYNLGTATDLTDEIVRVWCRFTELSKYSRLGIILFDDTSDDWRAYGFGGSLGSNPNSPGEDWLNIAVNPTNQTWSWRKTLTGEVWSISNIRKIGIYSQMATKPSKADNLFIDAIRYGKGLTITGTNDIAGDGWSEIADADEDSNNQYGVFRRRPGGYLLTGVLTFGDSAGTGSVDFTDNTNSTIFVLNRLFSQPDTPNVRNWSSGALGEAAVGFEIVGNGTGTTDFQLGNVLGSGDGRAGVLGGTITSTADKFFFDSETDTSDIDSCNLYGVTMENGGIIQLSGSTTQDVIGCKFTQCSEVQPNNAEFLNNAIISPDRGLEVVSGHNIKNIDFIAGSNEPLTDMMVTFDETNTTANSWTEWVDEWNDAASSPAIAEGWAVDDAFYIGQRNRFAKLTINVAVARSGGTGAWEYYNGSSWVSLVDEVDGTNAFSTTGTNDVTWTIQNDWERIKLDRFPPYYFVRLRATGATGTDPDLTQGFVKEIEENHLHVPAAGTYSLTGLTFFGFDAATLPRKFQVENSSNATTADSYADTNQDSTQALGNGTIEGVGQSITGNGGVLSRARFDLSKTGTPTGNVVAKVYAHSGTFGTSSVPTGTALATSNNVDVADLTTTLTLTDFEFEDEFTLVNTTNYVITLEYSGGDVSNYVNVGTDTSSPTHGGNFSTSTGTWSAVSGTDAVFYVYTGGIVKLNLSSSNATIDHNTGSPPGATIINNLTSVTLTGLVANTEVRVYETGTTTEIDGVENSGTSFTFQADATQFVDIVIHHIDYEHIRIENYDVPNSDTTLPIEQEFDRNYNNP